MPYRCTHSGKPQTAQEFSGIMYAAGRPIDNRPNPEGTSDNLLHKIVAGRDERNG